MTKSQTSWGYAGHVCGPGEWPKKFPTGTRQSPINISTFLDTRSTCCQHGNGNIQHHQSRLFATAAGQVSASHELASRMSGAHISSNNNDSTNEPVSGRLTVGVKQTRVAKHTRAHLDSGVCELDLESSSSSGYSHARNSSGGSSASSSPLFGEPQQDSNLDNGIGRHSKQTYHEDDNNNNHVVNVRNSNQIHTGQNTRHCVSKRKIFLGYPRYLETVQLSNTGHNWQVDIPPEIGLNTRK